MQSIAIDVMFEDKKDIFCIKKSKHITALIGVVSEILEFIFLFVISSYYP